MPSSIDLHAHSTCSDGTNTPSELLEKVAAAGITTFALTDHDTIAGIAEARAAADRLGVCLINGVEISCTHTVMGGYGKRQQIDKIIHVVALNFTDTDKMDAALKALQSSREMRGRQMVEKLAQIFGGEADAAAVFERIWQAVLHLANDNPEAVGRAHIAQALCQLGFVPSVQAAFDKYLADNKSAYVAIETMTMAAAIQLIHECGGLAVLAHPTRYKLSSTRTQRLIDDFAQAGGDGCELPNNEPLSTVAMVVRAMKKYELLASVGSDFHGSNMPWRKLGSVCKVPEGVVGVWTRF